MLKNSLEITDTTKTGFFELIFFQSDKKSDKITAVQISAVFWSL